jgi:hypothetical protein
LNKTSLLAGALALGSIFGGVSYKMNRDSEGQIPIAFSEIEATTQAFEAEGKTVPPLTKVYSLSNDVAMKVFESNNIALSKDRSHQTFAKELATRIDPRLKKHALISEYAREMPEAAQAALESLAKPASAAWDLSAVTSAFARAWDESHHDSYHTEFYTTRSCDSKNNCTTHLHSRQVYDYTDHYYNYHAQSGESAAKLLDAYLQNHPDLNIGERLSLAPALHGPNEAAMRESMKDRFKDAAPSPKEMLKLANTWATGSNLVQYLPGALSSHGTLKRLGPVWDGAKQTAHSTSYRTYSHSDSGPTEFQVSESARGHGNRIRENTGKITNGIAFAGKAVPELDKTIRQYVDAALKGKPGDPDKLRERVMTLSRDIYQKNFGGGFDVDPFKWGYVVLFTALGMAAGAGGGAAFEAWRNKGKSFSYGGYGYA